MGYNGIVFAGTLGQINFAFPILLPLLEQIDLTLFGSLGLGGLHANLSLQLSAALQANASIGLSISNPLAGFTAALQGIAALEAQIQLGLSLGISVQLSTQLSVGAAFAADLALQVGGLEVLLQAMLAVKLPAVTFAGLLSAGPLFVLSFEDMPLADAGAAIGASFASDLTHAPGLVIHPGDHVYGVVIVTSAPSAWVALQGTMLTH